MKFLIVLSCIALFLLIVFVVYIEDMQEKDRKNEEAKKFVNSVVSGRKRR